MPTAPALPSVLSGGALEREEEGDEEAVAVAAASPGPSFTEVFVPKAAESALTLDEMEKRQIVEALRRSKGKKVEAARLLGIDRKRLYRKMKKYGLE